MNKLRYRMRTLLLALLLTGTVWSSAIAQVVLEQQGEAVVIQNAGFDAQQMVKSAGKMMGATWSVLDNVGNTYEGSNESGSGGSGGSGGSSTPPVIVGDGYQGGGGRSGSGGSGGSSTPPVIVGDGYQEVLEHLRTRYGAVINRDPLLEVDVIGLPGVDDPLAVLLEALRNDRLEDGTTLIEHFRRLEVLGGGVFDEPAYEAVKPGLNPRAFPNDPLYASQWNLIRTGLDRAQWHPAEARKSVLIGVIDSGIGAVERNNTGLDGAAVTHVRTVPGTSEPVQHGLAVVSLLADRNHDGGGTIGLVGTWNEPGCGGQVPLFNRRPARILSFGVGDLAPSSLGVARAIRRSIAAGVDVINLSLRIAYSPLVEEAIQAALAQNIVVVAAAGNYPDGYQSRPATFPANLPGVIAVGSADATTGVTATSANEGLTLLGPGEDIVVGGPGNIWYNVSGTSFAAPHVTAAVAMMKTVQPALTPAEASEALRQTAQRKLNTIGFLDAFQAINHVVPPEQRAASVSPPYACTSLLDVDLVFGKSGDQVVPTEPSLAGNYPNPFNPATTIRFYVPDRQAVRLAVFNALGQEIALLAEGAFEKGFHEVDFRAEALPSGLYLYRLTAGGRTQTGRMMLAK